MAVFALLLAILLAILSNGQAQSDITFLGDNVAYVPADAEPGSYVYRLIALPYNSTFTIDSVEPANYTSLFNLDIDDDLIYNDETYPQSLTLFDVTVQATNELIDASFFQIITVLVLPSSETPLFHFTNYNSVIEENQVLGTVIEYIQAFSLSPTISQSYSITNGPFNEFYIDEETGLVTLNGSLDREAIDFYSLNIIYDDDSGTAMTVLNITVLDVNDNTPVFELYEYTFSVEENMAPGKLVGVVSATDADDYPNNVIVYELLIDGNATSAFYITMSEGKIYTNSVLDYEKQNLYELTVTAHDMGEIPMSNISSVIVSVVDVSYECPLFLQSEYVEVVIYDIKDPPGVGHHILTIEVYPNPNPPEYSEDLVYTMNITDESFINDPVFAINATSGYISLARNDISIIGNYMFEVKPDLHPMCSTSIIVQISIVHGCPEEIDDIYGIHWSLTPIDTVSTQSCGDSNILGLATRPCNSSGDWLSINDTQCQSHLFKEISILVSSLDEDPAALNDQELIILSNYSKELIDKLASATNISIEQRQLLFPIELSTSNEVLHDTLNVFKEAVKRDIKSETFIADTSLKFSIVFSNLLESSNKVAWTNLQTIDATMGSELLLQNAESFGNILASYANEKEDIIISAPNIVFSALKANLNLDSNIIFPQSTDLENFSHNETNTVITLPAALFSNISNGSVVFTLFNNLQDFIFFSLTFDHDDNLKPASLILSAQIQNNAIPVQNYPVHMEFKLLTNITSNQTCSFWNFSNPIGDGSWSTMNVRTLSDGSDVVQCISEHLTSFAVLVDVRGITETLSEEEALALSVVTYIGLSISTVFLVITVIFFTTFGKVLFTSVHYFVHLNFGLSLLLGNIIFVAGIETAVGNKIVCTIVAALLHYLYLSVFCWMLCEGIMMYLMLVLVFSQLAKKWWIFMLIGWVLPLLPVIITVAASYENYTAGEKFCWLSTSHNVIWGFITPVILIILINTAFFIRILIVLSTNRSKYLDKGSKNKGVGVIVISTMKGSVVILPLLGLSWTFGFLAIHNNTTVFAWIFTILNAFQGLAIFFLHVIRNEKVKKIFSNKWKKKKNTVHHNKDQVLFQKEKQSFSAIREDKKASLVQNVIPGFNAERRSTLWDDFSLDSIEEITVV